VWCGKKYLQDQVCFNTVITKWIELLNKNKNVFFYDVEQFFAHLEYIRNGTIFRCHPNYKSKGEWYDWVMVHFDIASHKRSRSNKKLGMWSSHYFPSKIMCFFCLPDDETIYAIVHSTKPSNHDSNSILFKRWELKNTIIELQNGGRDVTPNFHVIDVDCFGDPILAIEDYTILELTQNKNKAMVTVVLPFARAWPNKFMSSYQK